MWYSKLVLFIPPDVILQDLSIKIARGGFKWCSPVLSTGSEPHHQVVWKYPLPQSALLGESGCLMREAGVWLALLQLLLCPGNSSVPAWPGMGWEVELPCYSGQNSDGN